MTTKTRNLLLLIFILLGSYISINGTISRVYLLVPKDITNISSTVLYCYGREWWFDEKSKPRIMNGILHFTCSSGSHVRTFPEEVNQPPIIITGKKYLVFELARRLEEHIYFNYSILDNNFNNYKGKVDGYNHNEIIIPLPLKSKSINHLQVSFSAMKCILSIKSIYIY